MLFGKQLRVSTDKGHHNSPHHLGNIIMNSRMVLIAKEKDNKLQFNPKENVQVKNIYISTVLV